MSKIYSPNSGTVTTHGNIVPLLQLGIGFHPELTARDNIITYGIILGFKKDWIKQKIPEILKFAELEKFSDVKMKNFSSGMISRLGFSTAVQIDPEIILVDEVLSVGDISFQEKCLQTFTDFKKRKKTIIFVTHDLNQIIRICDRALMLKNGKIAKIGDPSSVVDYYIKSQKNN
jgi:ABC-type polysaccharide/polyol phosphate transport system ATPase subunit